MDTTEREQHDNAVEEPILEHMDVGANVEIASESGSDDSLPEYTCQPGCTIPVGDNNRPIHYLSHLVTDDMLSLRQTSMHSSTSRVMISLLSPESDVSQRVSLM